MWTIFLSSRNARELCVIYLKIIVIIIVIFHNLMQQGKGSQIEIGRGASCRSNDDCDSSKFLTCTGSDNSCDCRKSEGLIWVPEENSCMIMEDAPCGRRLNQPKCVTSASCSIAGKCECDDGFLRNGFGKCDLGYNKVCSESEICADRYLLQCIKSTKSSQSECKCRNEGIELVWDENKQKCVSTAGGSCDAPGSPLYNHDDRLECIKNAQCSVSGFCQCNPGFIQTPEASCLLRFGERCSAGFESDCNRFQFLLCQSGKCDCEFYAQMKYDMDIKQCRSLAGESCDATVDSGNFDISTNESGPKCVADSFCKQRPGSRRGICTCLPGMEQLADRTCSRYNKGHGHSCSTSIDCNKEKFLDCVMDEREGSHCDCIQGHMYYDGKDCRVLAGKSCTENKLCGNNSYCEGDWCVCEKGYKIGTRGCLPQWSNNPGRSQNSEFFGQGQIQSATISSNVKTACGAFDESSLDRERCDCQTKFGSHIWLEEMQRCLALVGTNCLSNSECVPNAVCDSTAKICQCSTATYTTKDGTFIRSTNSKVSDNPRVCTEIYTLKSVRAHEVLSSSGRNMLSSITNISCTIIIIVTVAQNMNLL